MRNLKRALALALSATMLLGMMVVGTGASYSDVAADNDYIEAIEVMQAVGVMTGTGENKFEPDSLVTRHEAAVIMANLLELEVDDFETATSPFTDVADWAEPYVSACYADGIMAGIGGGKFGGDQNVTAVQMGLMLLKALGYFQFQGDFGDDWQLATSREASKIELFEDVNTSTAAKLTRGQVAQMCLNALEADIVDWEGDVGTSVTLPDGTSVITGYNIDYESEKATGNDPDDYTDEDGDSDDDYIQLVEDLFDEDLVKFENTDEFGRPSTKWEWENSEVGTYSDKADHVYNERVTKDTLYKDLGKDLYEDLFDPDESETLTVWKDGVETKVITETMKKNAKTDEDIDGLEDAVKEYINKNDTAKINGRASSVEVYIDDDKNVDIVIINTYVVQAADDYNEKDELLKIDVLNDHGALVDEKELDVDDFPIIEDVAEDDYLLVTIAEDEIHSVKKAEVITGRVNTYTKADTVTIDGVKYNYAGTIDGDDDDNGKAVEFSVGEDTTVVLADGHIIYVDEASVSSGKYVYVAEIVNDSNFTTADPEFVAKAYFLDGTEKTIDIKDEFKNYDGAGHYEDVKGGETGWFTYSENDSGVYTLYWIDEDETTEAEPNEDGVLTENGIASLGGVKMNSDTMFVVIDDDGDVEIYSGVKNVPTITEVASAEDDLVAYIVLDDPNGKYADYVFIDAEDHEIDDSSSSDDFLFILKGDSIGVDADEDDYYVFKSVLNGEYAKVTLTYDEGLTVKAGTLYSDLGYNSKGYVDSVKEVEVGDEDYDYIDTFTGAEIDFEKDVLAIDNLSFVLADDAELILIACDTNIKNDDGEDAEVYSGISGNSLDNECDDYLCDGKYYVQVNDDNELTTLYLTITKTVEKD